MGHHSRFLVTKQPVGKYVGNHNDIEVVRKYYAGWLGREHGPAIAQGSIYINECYAEERTCLLFYQSRQPSVEIRPTMNSVPIQGAGKG